MEFPDLGKQCSESMCNQLDFLPMKCDACDKVFCSKHFPYTQHNCTESYKKDNQVPVCPLCNTPIPVQKGGSVDDVVGRHIDNDCQSETAQTRRTVYSNRCALKGCKQKEVMQVICEKCQKNFCLRHRNELDHSCQGFEDSGREVSRAGAAAVSRVSSSSAASSSSSATARSSSSKSGGGTPQRTILTSIGQQLNRERQERNVGRGGGVGVGGGARTRPTAVAVNALQQPGLSEDEAIQRAIALSLGSQGVNSTSTTVTSAEQRAQEEADAALARALHESELVSSRRPVTQSNPSSDRSCSMS